MMSKLRFPRFGGFIALILAIALMLGGCKTPELPDNNPPPTVDDGGDLPDGGDQPDGGNVGESEGGGTEDDGLITLDNIPAWDGESAFVIVNDNKPFFEEGEYVTESFERYADLDALGRCGVTYACIGRDIMPTEERGSISSVTPSGWVNNKYDSDVVPGGWIYNRCHLIGWQLTGENANKENLITGTQFINIEGMLPFENMVADYVKDTGNHVLYRVTPIFEGYNLVASGVLMEAWSVEDMGEGICFCIYAYNAQPGIYINYYDGNNRLAAPDDVLGGGSDEDGMPGEDVGGDENDYVLNTSSKKIHKPDCRYSSSMKEENRQEYHGYIGDLLENGYEKCKTCNPE